MPRTLKPRPPAPETISRDEYQRSRRSGNAGPKSGLLDPSAWPASHYILRFTPQGTALVPVNVRRNP